MYGGMGPSSGGYPEVPPNAMGMSGFPGGSNYQGGPTPYMGRFPPYQRMPPPPHVGMMPAHTPASPGVATEGEV